MSTVQLAVCTVPHAAESECPPASRRVVEVDDAKLTATTLQIQMVPEPVNSQRLQDQYELFGLALAVAATLWGIKQFIKLFSVDRD